MIYRIAIVGALALAFPFVVMGLSRALYLALCEWTAALGLVVAESPPLNMQAFAAGALATLLTCGAVGLILHRVLEPKP